MTTAADTVANSGDEISGMLEGDRIWLSKQPGIEHWETCSERIVQQIDAWLDELTPRFCGDADLLDEDGVREDFRNRVWLCWGFHWRNAAKEKPCAGEEVAKKLRGVGEAGGSHDLIADVVLVAVAQKNDRALAELREKLMAAGQASIKPNCRSMLDDWVQELLLPSDGTFRFASFMGRGAFASWATRCLIRAQARYEKRRQRESDSAKAPEPASPENAELLAMLRDAMKSKLTEREQLIVKMRIEGFPNLDVAGALGTHPGHVSRLFKVALEKLRAALKNQDF